MKALLSVAAVAAALLMGCQISRNIEASKLDQIQKGVTTREEVITILGPARQTVEHDGPDGRTIALTYLWHRKEQVSNMMLGVVNPRSQTVTIVIGPDGKVFSISKVEHTSN